MAGETLKGRKRPQKEWRGKGERFIPELRGERIAHTTEGE